jgi:hypothetical protein
MANLKGDTSIGTVDFDTDAGAVNLNGNQIKSLATPTENDDAANRQYVDDGLATKAATSHDHAGTYAPAVHDHDADYVNVTGDTMSGDLDMGGTSKVTNVALPDDPGDVASKDYVDNIGGQSAHGSLGGLDLDHHQQYAMYEILPGSDPVTVSERPGLLVVRTDVEVDEGLDFMQKQGGTMTGPLLLQSDPTSDMEAATKQYADSTHCMISCFTDSTAAIPTSALTTTALTNWVAQVEAGGWVVNSDHLVVPVSGWYQCNGQIGVNNSAIGNTMTSPSANTSGLGFQIAVSGMIEFAAGDSLSLRGRQDSGADQSPNAWLEAFLLRPT